MSADGRHERAVAQSLQLAQDSAAIGDFVDALAWLQTVEAVDGPLPTVWERKRAVWERQCQDGTLRVGGRFARPDEAAASARQNGHP